MLTVYYNLRTKVLSDILLRKCQAENLNHIRIDMRTFPKTLLEAPDNMKVVVIEARKKERIQSLMRKLSKFVKNLDRSYIAGMLLLTNLEALSSLSSMVVDPSIMDVLPIEISTTTLPEEFESRFYLLMGRVIKAELFRVLIAIEKLETTRYTIKEYLLKILKVLSSSPLIESIGIAYIDPRTHLIDIYEKPDNFMKKVKYKNLLDTSEVNILKRQDKKLIVLPLKVSFEKDFVPLGIAIIALRDMAISNISSEYITALSQSISKGLSSSYQQELLSRAFKEMSAIYDVSISFSSASTLKDLLRLVVKKAKSALGGDVVSLMLLDEDTNTLRIEYAEGLPKEIVQTVRQRLGEGIAGTVALTGKPLLISDIHKEFIELSELEHGMRSSISVPLKSSSGKVLGVLNVSKVSKYIFSKEDEQLLFNLATLAANAIERTKLYETLKTSYEELEETYISVITALSRAFEAKDHYHKGHMEKVARYSIAIALEYDPKLLETDILRIAAMFHDLGKLAIPDEILQKPGKLTDEEYEIIKIHPEAGESILAPLKFLREVAKIVRHHQERWDGKGYPDGLKGEEIPLMARIIAVADALDAMTSKRPYRDPMSLEEAIEEIVRNSGTQFDPKVVDALLKAYEKGLIS